jgi:uncharacterized membrane protein
MMIIESCRSGNWGFFGNFGGWDWIGLIFALVIWVGLIAGVALFVIWAIRHARVPAAPSTSATGQPTSKEILQAQYARGEITREQFELGKQNIEESKSSSSLKGESK